MVMRPQSSCKQREGWNLRQINDDDASILIMAVTARGLNLRGPSREVVMLMQNASNDLATIDRYTRWTLLQCNLRFIATNRLI
jgi:hypothetical protein